MNIKVICALSVFFAVTTGHAMEPRRNPEIAFLSLGIIAVGSIVASSQLYSVATSGDFGALSSICGVLSSAVLHQGGVATYELRNEFASFVRETASIAALC